MYLVGNILFIPIDQSFDDTTSKKYITASISGYLFASEISTEEEILKQYPGVKKVKDFLEVYNVYNSK
jgi:hypothetical protein